MSTITASSVRELREITGVGMMECKKALEECSGDIEKSIELLRKKGAMKAAKKADRETNEGFIGSYIHSNGKIGVLVEVLCETDFVGKNDNFQSFAKDVAMHVAAASPQYLTREEIPAEIISKEKEIYAVELKGKPENIISKILDGKIEKFYSECCLLDQKFVKDDKISVKDYLNQKITEMGENIVIKRFVRYQIG